MPDITIRPAEKDDYPGIYRLLLQIAGLHAQWRPDLFRPHPKLTEKDFRRRLKKSAKQPILVAISDGRLVGHMFAAITHVKQRSHIKGRCMLYVEDLCVDEACRGQGVGRRLMQEADRLAREHECTLMELNVYSCNESAVAFYTSLGYTPQRLGLEKRLPCAEPTAK